MRGNETGHLAKPQEQRGGEFIAQMVTATATVMWHVLGENFSDGVWGMREIGPYRLYGHEHTAGEVTKEIHPSYLLLQDLSEACGLVNSQMAMSAGFQAEGVLGLKSPPFRLCSGHEYLELLH